MAKTFRLASVAQAALAISAAALSAQAFAVTPDDGGTIVFSGAVISTTCSVKVGKDSVPTSGSQVTVYLPTVKSDAFKASTPTAGETEFTISMSDCYASATKLTTTFKPPAGAVTTTGKYASGIGRLLNKTSSTTPASSVVLGLQVKPTGGSWTEVDLSKDLAVDQSGKQSTDLSSSTATQYYRVFYEASGDLSKPAEIPGAGAVGANLPFVISYN
jgi:major type 1 subunit fimbrin (pilin)